MCLQRFCSSVDIIGLIILKILAIRRQSSHLVMADRGFLGWSIHSVHVGILQA